MHLKLVQPDQTPTFDAFLQFPWRFFFKLIPCPIVRHKRRKQIMPGLRRSNFKSTASILRCHLADQFPFCPADLVHRPNLQKLSENKNVYGRFVHVCHYIRPIVTTFNKWQLHPINKNYIRQMATIFDQWWLHPTNTDYIIIRPMATIFHNLHSISDKWRKHATHMHLDVAFIENALCC